jgi:glycerophosphoryl diester phosphodiesterase
VVLTKDLVVLVSHEPWFSPEICSVKEIETNNIFQMTYGEVQLVICGNQLHPRFPEQKAIATHKPSLIDVIHAVRNYCDKNNREMPRFNIELKSEKGWKGVYLPDTRTFVERVFQVLRSLGVEELCTIQSFDPEVLNAFMILNTQLQFAFLIDEKGPVLELLYGLNKMPHIFSPNYKNVSAETVKQAHDLKMRIIPWTVNTEVEMREMIELGVDGIITDFPNLIGKFY